MDQPAGSTGIATKSTAALGATSTRCVSPSGMDLLARLRAAPLVKLRPEHMLTAEVLGRPHLDAGESQRVRELRERLKAALATRLAAESAGAGPAMRTSSQDASSASGPLERPPPGAH